MTPFFIPYFLLLMWFNLIDYFSINQNINIMMPEINWLAIVVAGLIPTIIGTIYYGPLFGNAWYASMGKTKEEMEPSNPAVTYGLALVVALLASFSLKMLIELMHKDVNASGELIFGSFHTFGHGALHGAFICIFLVVPVLISFSLFHKFSGKNIILNVLFWIICFALMGGILDAWN